MCTRAKHPRGKGNCADNPNCVFGLGEGKDGVWAKSPAAIAQLLQHPPVRLREGWKQAARTAHRGAEALHDDDSGATASDSEDGTRTPACFPEIANPLIYFLDPFVFHYRFLLLLPSHHSLLSSCDLRLRLCFIFTAYNLPIPFEYMFPVLLGDPLIGSSVQPAGLNNLGATCYLNTLLQTLFHCLPFRRAVYAFPETPSAASSSNRTTSSTAISPGPVRSSNGDGGSESSGSNKEGAALESCPGTPVVRELQRLFAHLDEEGAGQWGDTSQLVTLLGFDPSYQQDPIECWKLLGATIEEAFKATVRVVGKCQKEKLRKLLVVGGLMHAFGDMVIFFLLVHIVTNCTHDSFFIL